MRTHTKDGEWLAGWLRQIREDFPQWKRESDERLAAYERDRKRATVCREHKRR